MKTLTRRKETLKNNPMPGGKFVVGNVAEAYAIVPHPNSGGLYSLWIMRIENDRVVYVNKSVEDQRHTLLAHITAEVVKDA